MKLFETGRKQERLNDYSVFAKDVSAGTFNLIQGGIVVIGLIINWVLLVLAHDYTKDLNPIVLIFIYIAVWLSGVVLATEVPNTVVVCIAYYMIVAPIGIIAASVIDLFSVKSGAEVVLQTVIIVTCVTAAVTLFATLRPEQCDNLLTLSGIGGIGLAAAITIVALVSWDTSIWAWFAAIFISFCFIYDMAHSQVFSKTVKHAVDCAVDTYLDVAFFIIRVPIVLFSMYIESYRWNN
ncbi:MAG: hypothetical protein J5738_05440 [Lachnospiraceae bacterium]|nr:hypothetical protein [Lachnospiraceae bacterium]